MGPRRRGQPGRRAPAGRTHLCLQCPFTAPTARAPGALEDVSELVRPKEVPKEAYLPCGLCGQRVLAAKSGLWHHVGHCVLLGAAGNEDTRHQVCGLCGSADGTCLPRLPSANNHTVMAEGCSASPLRRNLAYFQSNDFNIPIPCTDCPVGARPVWRYNLRAHYARAHLPAAVPAQGELLAPAAVRAK